MAAALVQHLGESDAGSSYSATHSISMSKTVSLGNTIVVGIGALDTLGTTPTCADNLGNSYTLVECRDGTYDSAVFYAPVTNAGTLTGITVTVGSGDDTRFTAMEAAEFSGVGALSSAGAGTATGGSVATQNPVNSKAIPADGIAVGFTGGNTNQSYSAGSASGSPSATTVLVDAHPSGNFSGGLFYALGGGSGTTGFTMNVTTSGSGNYSNAGAVFSPASAPPDPDPDEATPAFRNFR